MRTLSTVNAGPRACWAVSTSEGTADRSVPAGHVVGVRMLWAPALCRIEAVTLVVYRSEMGKGRWWNLGSGAEAGSQEASPAVARMQPLDPERGQT